MTTLQGNASKGEKGKQRYRSLDINSLYQVSRPEQHQQKNSLPRRNVGMQSLGKIPPTRRVPANLPSLKSEHSGNDPAVSLVPTGSTGWGSKPGETGPQPPSPPQSTTATTPTTQSSTPVATVATLQPQQPQQQQPSVTSTASAPTTVVTSVVTTSAPAIPTQSSHGDKSWSAITSSGGESVPNYFAHQSPFFHQEFPSLSGSDAGTTPCPPMTTKPDTQYASGPSLRPQTEGSWMQGGSRPQGQMGVGAGNPQGTAPVQGPLPLPHLPPGIDVGGGRNNLGQSGVGVAQGGPVPPQGHHMPPPHFKGVLPSFMYRPNFPGGFPPTFTNPMHGQLRTRTVLSYPNENRPAPATDPEDLVPRPIIKEEDLNRMDDIARDAGWAGQDDIDYNQELTFSDDEGGQEKETNKNKTSRTPTQTREQEKHPEKDSESVDREDRSSRENGREKASSQPPENRTAPSEPSRGWQQPRSPAEYRPSPPNVVNFPSQPMRGHPHHMNDGGRLLDEDEMWQEKLRLQNMKVAIATEKARQRKNEEEKRYEESRQAIERAKQRKEEEEKRYEESRQAASKKLQKLEEKMGVSSSSGSGADDKDRTETSTPPTSSVVTPQTVNIALPDWEKDKDIDRSRTSSEGKEDRSTKDSVDNFRQMTQMEGRSNFIRDRERERDRDMRGERDLSNQHQVSGQPAFSRQFQSNLPPRFQRQQAERPQQAYFRQQSGGSPQPTSAAQMCEPRWTSSSHFSGSGGSLKNRRNRTDSDVSDRDREDDRSGKDSIRDRRDRNTPDNNYDRDRYRHDRARDNRAGNNTYDNKWKSSGSYYDGPDYSNSYRDYERSHDYDRHGRERDQEVDERRDRDAWEREKENRYYDEHMGIEKPSDSYKPHASMPMDPFEDRDMHQMARHEGERIDRDRDSDRGSVSERRTDYEKEQILCEQPQRAEPSQHTDSRDRPERPQRPDSRDSRASRESRNSRDSMREDTKSIQECVNDREFSWADSHFEPEHKEERPKRKDYREESRRDMYPSYPQRHIPGPITKERLEAAERGNEPAKRNMLPLVRSDKKSDLKKLESQKEKQEQKSEDVQDAWQSVPSVPEPSPPPQPASKSWAETTEEPVSSSPVPEKSLSNEQDSVSETVQNEGAEESQQQQKSEIVESNAVIKSERDEQDVNHRIESHREKGGRGGRGMRHDSRGGPRQSWGSSTYRSAWRGEGRGRRGGSRGQPRPQPSQDWGHSESEASADEVSASTESGKEERERRQDRGRKNAPRSPKQVSRKADKENRSRESRRIDGDKSSCNDTRHYEKRGSYDSQRPVNCGREGGFAPRGEPSRRGRGAAFRARGNTPNVGQRVNSYGPPTSSKSPFMSQSCSTNEDKKVDEEVDKNTEVTSERKNEDQQDNCASSVDLSVEDKTKKNQQLLSAGIKGSGTRQSTKPPRYKSENDRRERSAKSKDENRRNQRGSLKGNGTGGSGSGGDQGDEAWETTSDMSEQEDKDREDLHESQRRNYSSGRHVSRGSGRRNSHSARSGGDKRGHDISREVSRSSGSANVGSGQVNMNGRGPMGSSKMNSSSTPSPHNSKDQISLHRVDDVKYSDTNSVFQLDTKKQQRTDKEKNSINRVADMSNFSSMVVVDGRTEEEHSVFAADSGFQEVRSKKNVKEANRQQKEDVPQKGPRGGSTGSKDRGKSGGNKPGAQSPSPVCGLPSIGPPASQNNPPQPSNKTFERKLSNKLPPRLMKQKQQQMRQQQQQQQQQQEEVAEMNKLNQGVPLFPIKDLTSPAPPPTVNAWDKPITALRTATSPPTSTSMQLTLSTQDNCGIDIGEHPPSGASSQRSSPNGEKVLNKMNRETVEKTVLDGTSPPVQTIIFENTSLKEKISAPGDLAMKSKYNHHLKNQRMDKTRDRKLEDESGHVGLGVFKPAGTDMKTQDNKNDPIQMPVSFSKNEDSADMKLDFAFDSDLSQLTDDKSSKGMGLPHSMQMGQSSTAADSKLLNFKIAAVKKVWDSTVIEHHTEDGNVSTPSSFTQGFGNSVEDPTSYVKSGVGVMDGSGVVQVDDSSSLNSGEVYSTSQQMQNSGNSYSSASVVSVPNVIKNDPNSSSSNVCKQLAPQVKPQPQAVMSSAGLGGHPHPGPLSPPPGAFNSSSAQPSGHINFQPAAQYSSVGVSAIPSPPAMLYGSQQIPAQELYHQTFQIGNTQVIGGQARSQFSQLPPFGLSQGLGQTSAFSQQASMYLQTPPSGAPPDIYQSQFRLQPHSFGSSQTMSSNHNAVLISSTSNSLMSASVKPSSQQIGAIGSKGGFQPSQPSTAMFIQYDPSSVMNQNYSHIVQQRPGNNIVSAMQPSSSFYSASAGGGATGFYQPTNSTLQAAQTAQTIPTQFGVQGYSTQSPAAAQVGPVGMPTYTSQIYQNKRTKSAVSGSSCINSFASMAQQYRTSAPSYLKSSGAVTLVTDPSKSPSTNQQDVLNSVFSAGIQIASPKSRGTGNGGGSGKPGTTAGGPSQQQPSPTQGHHKITPYHNVSQVMQQQQQQAGGRGAMSIRGGSIQAQVPRYPSPIQRPVAFQQPIPGVPTANMMPGRHRVTSRAPPHLVNKIPSSAASAQYYSSQNNGVKLETGGLENKNEVNGSNNECNKLSDNGSSVTTNKQTAVSDTPAEDSKPKAD